MIGLLAQSTKNSRRAAKLVLTSAFLLFSLVCQAGSAYAVDVTDSGSIGLNGLVPTKPPTQAAVILVPKSGKHFKESRIEISGTCEAKMAIEIYKNKIFAGSTICTNQGTFKLEIDLVRGKNKLIARTRDNLNQYGPDSDTVTVFYDVKVPINTSPNVTNPPAAYGQLIILIDAIYQGQGIGQPFNIDLRVIGGQPPYAITIDWGDGQQDLISKPDSRKFSVSHQYDYAGIYKFVVRSSDALGESAYLEATAVVNGPAYSIEDRQQLIDTSFERLVDKLLVALAIILAMLFVYWLGQRQADGGKEQD